MKKRILSTITISIMLIGILAFVTGCGNGPDYSSLKLEDYVDLAQYKGVTYKLGDATVTDDEIEAEVKTRLDAAAETTVVQEGVVEDGSTINVSYEGKIDGKTFEGGSTESSDIIIGKTSMIDGFVEGLIGKSVGDTVTLNLKFPDDYHSSKVAGKDVVFTVKIKGIKIKTVPELTDEWVAANSKVKTVAEYRESVKSELEKAKQKQNKQTTKTAVWQEVFSKSKIKKYPEDALKYEKAKIIENYKETAEKTYKTTYEDYLKKYMNTTEKKFEKTAEDYAKTIVGQKLVLNAVASKEKLTVSDKEYKKHLEKVLKNAGLDEKSFEKSYKMSIEKYAEKMDWKTSMLYDKVTDKIIELGTQE